MPRLKNRSNNEEGDHNVCGAHWFVSMQSNKMLKIQTKCCVFRLAYKKRGIFQYAAYCSAFFWNDVIVCFSHQFCSDVDHKRE